MPDRLPTIDFRPYDPAFIADPYPFYARLRREAPILPVPEMELTFLSRHRDVSAILRDRRFGRDIRHIVPVEELRHHSYPTWYPTWYRFIRGSFIDLEPPAHTRLRGLVAKAFTRRNVESLRPRVAEVAERLASEAVERGRIELIRDFATPIPLTMIAELMGIPASDRDQLVAWSHAIVRLFELEVTPEEGAAAEQATIEFVEYLRPIVAARRARPGEDLISEMVHVEIDGDRLAEDDIIATAILTLNAGHEATVHAIANGVIALVAWPGEYERLRTEPGILKTAVDELLRYDAPLQMFERWVLEDLEWEGHPLRRGEKVGLLFGSANRDEERFVDPDRLDLGRTDNPHVSFGAGIHYCVGAPLARIELEEAFAALARHARSLHADLDHLDRIESLVFRGVRRLDLEVA